MQWLELVQAAGEARLAWCSDDLWVQARVRACPGAALGVEGDVRVAAAAAPAATLISLAHDAAGRPQLNGRDLADWLRDLADGLSG